MTRFTLAAPAKINLYLHVVGRRPDGYHLLDGLVAFADISDSLAIAPSDGIAFDSDGPYADALGEPSANLVVRAARALAEATGRDANVTLRLTKRLPVASGIGGGSADAAACLRGLSRLWGLDPESAVVMRVAAGLGADLPACVIGRAGFIGGIGTEIDPAPQLPETGILLVNPGVALPTPDVYRKRQGPFTAPARFAETPQDAADLARLLLERGNDLTEAAVALVPAIAEVLAQIAASRGCLLARMSGSGATCFGLYADRTQAARAAAAIRQAHPDWWIESGRLLDDPASLD
jgi:4-diphosphocytidyl-2-C-methyl-D-erythritol kinase